jgi:protein SHQ1
MITPRFECSQDDNYVIVHIKVPHMRESEIEYSICDNVFRFYVKPYFLRLTFQQSLKQDGSDYSKYDIQNGVFICYLPKQNKGEKFENLNMLTQLLSVPKKEKKPLVELVSTDSKDITEKPELDVDFEQELPPLMSELKISTTVTYGFDSKYNDFFTRYHADHVSEVLDLLKPETTSKNERTKERVEQERTKIDPERYM